MKCFFCKTPIVAVEAHRVFVPARDRRERSRIRVLCPSCYRTFTAARDAQAEDAPVEAPADVSDTRPAGGVQ